VGIAAKLIAMNSNCCSVVFFIIASLALIAFPSHASDLRDTFERTEATDVARGSRAYDAGDYDLALKLLAQHAKDGSADAELLVGLMNWYGFGLPKDYAEAMRLFLLSAAQGNARAMNVIAFSYENGLGVPADLSQAVSWYTKAADGGERRALNNLAILFSEGRGVAKDPAKAFALWQQSAAKGDVGAMAHLGDALWYGKGAGSDHTAAMDWWRKATADPRITFVAIGRQYLEGKTVPKDEALTAQLFAAAAASGDAATEGALGWMYYLGVGVKQDIAHAQKLTEDAAGAGAVEAMVYAAVIDAQTGNLAASANWARQAAEKGNARGEALYGVDLLNGAGTDVDVNEAVLWLRRAAAQGDAVGECTLGFVYQKGAGILEKDAAKAIALLQQSAAQHYAPAEEALGENDIGATGGVVDYAAALRLFRDAAEEGDPEAMNDIGTMFGAGQAVAKDAAQAAKWFERAAPFAQPNAMHNLAGMLYAGVGAPHDVAKAYYWAALALRTYNPGKEDDVPKIASLRDTLLPSIVRALPQAARTKIDADVAAFKPKTWAAPFPPFASSAKQETDISATSP
jgi:TPR repeat protein